MNEETCLWVYDEQQKQSRMMRRGVDPETLRCKEDGPVWCAPCAEEFKKTEDPWDAFSRSAEDSDGTFL